jgi:hypothetical protein
LCAGDRQTPQWSPPLSLVGDKAAKLLAPSVMPTTLASPALVRVRISVKFSTAITPGAPRAADNLLGENVAILAKPSPTTTRAFQMPLSRLRALGSQFAFEPEISLFNLLAFSLPKKSGGRCHRRLMPRSIPPTRPHETNSGGLMSTTRCTHRTGVAASLRW